MPPKNDKYRSIDTIEKEIFQICENEVVELDKIKTPAAKQLSNSHVNKKVAQSDNNQVIENQISSSSTNKQQENGKKSKFIVDNNIDHRRKDTICDPNWLPWFIFRKMTNINELVLKANADQSVGMLKAFRMYYFKLYASNADNLRFTHCLLDLRFKSKYYEFMFHHSLAKGYNSMEEFEKNSAQQYGLKECCVDLSVNNVMTKMQQKALKDLHNKFGKEYDFKLKKLTDYAMMKWRMREEKLATKTKTKTNEMTFEYFMEHSNILQRFVEPSRPDLYRRIYGNLVIGNNYFDFYVSHGLEFDSDEMNLKYKLGKYAEMTGTSGVDCQNPEFQAMFVPYDIRSSLRNSKIKEKRTTKARTTIHKSPTVASIPEEEVCPIAILNRDYVTGMHEMMMDAETESGSDSEIDGGNDFCEEDMAKLSSTEFVEQPVPKIEQIESVSSEKNDEMYTKVGNENVDTEDDDDDDCDDDDQISSELSTEISHTPSKESPVKSTVDEPTSSGIVSSSTSFIGSTEPTHPTSSDEETLIETPYVAESTSKEQQINHVSVEIIDITESDDEDQETRTVEQEKKVFVDFDYIKNNTNIIEFLLNLFKLAPNPKQAEELKSKVDKVAESYFEKEIKGKTELPVGIHFLVPKNDMVDNLPKTVQVPENETVNSAEKNARRPIEPEKDHLSNSESAKETFESSKAEMLPNEQPGPSTSVSTSSTIVNKSTEPSENPANELDIDERVKKALTNLEYAKLNTNLVEFVTNRYAKTLKDSQFKKYNMAQVIEVYFNRNFKRATTLPAGIQLINTNEMVTENHLDHDSMDTQDQVEYLPRRVSKTNKNSKITDHSRTDTCEKSPATSCENPALQNPQSENVLQPKSSIFIDKLSKSLNNANRVLPNFLANNAGPLPPKTILKQPPKNLKNPNILKEIHHQKPTNSPKTQAKLLEKAVNGNQVPRRIVYEDSQADEVPTKKRKIEEPAKPVSPRKFSSQKNVAMPRKLILPDTPIPSNVVERLNRTTTTPNATTSKMPETMKKMGVKEMAVEAVSGPIIDITSSPQNEPAEQQLNADDLIKESHDFSNLEVDSFPESQTMFTPAFASTQQFPFAVPYDPMGLQSPELETYPEPAEVIIENVNTQQNKSVSDECDPLESVPQPVIIKKEKLSQYSPCDSVEFVVMEEQIIEVADESVCDVEQLLKDNTENASRPALIQDSFLVKKIAQLNKNVQSSQKSSSSNESQTQNQSPRNGAMSTCELLKVLSSQSSQEVSSSTHNAQNNDDSDDDELMDIVLNPTNGEFFFL